MALDGMMIIMIIMTIMMTIMMSMAIVILLCKKVTWSAMELACADADFIGKKG